jgi:hypothetical protein
MSTAGVIIAERTEVASGKVVMPGKLVKTRLVTQQNE